MVKCTAVENAYGHLWVEFPDYPDKSLYLQSEDDVASFLRNCGAATAEDVTRCPEEYLDVATKGERQ